MRPSEPAQSPNDPSLALSLQAHTTRVDHRPRSKPGGGAAKSSKENNRPFLGDTRRRERRKGSGPPRSQAGTAPHPALIARIRRTGTPPISRVQPCPSRKRIFAAYVSVTLGRAHTHTRAHAHIHTHITSHLSTHIEVDRLGRKERTSNNATDRLDSRVTASRMTVCGVGKISHAEICHVSRSRPCMTRRHREAGRRT